MRRKNILNNKIRAEKWNITTSINEIQRIMREYFENLYINKWKI
jgi:hypothetical protein